jgi:hypothetical protein
MLFGSPKSSIDDEENITLQEKLLELGELAIARRDVELLKMVYEVAMQLSVINNDGAGDIVCFFDVAEYLYESSRSLAQGESVESNEWATDLKRRLGARWH